METVKRQAKKSFAILSLIILISSICGPAMAATQAEKKATDEATLRTGRLFASPGDYNSIEIPPEASYKPGELLVRFAPKARGIQRNTAEKHEVLNALGCGVIKREYRIVPGLSLVKLPAGMTVQDALKTFNKAKGILYAEPNYRVKVLSTFPNDPCFPQQWGMYQIHAPEAWDISTGSSEVIVAVIDTGVDYTHPDLAANMWHNPGEIPGNDIDDDKNGYTDDIYGYDFCSYGFGKWQDSDPMDDNGHGTHCAGTIGAVGNNGEGVVGVCWNVKIMALKFMNSNEEGWVSEAAACIDYSVQMGAKLTSNSWRVDPPVKYMPGTLKDAIDNAGAAGQLFVAAAGNGNNKNIDEYPVYPAACPSPYIISVLATDQNDNKPWWSNYGPNSVDLGAPGVGILSCWLSGGYRSFSATSMAAPYVAGACALVWSACPFLSNNEVKDIILQTVDQIPDLNDLCVTEGRLNLYNALSLADVFCKAREAVQIEKADGISGCVGLGHKMTYTIDYGYSYEPNIGVINDVNIIDYLPEGVEFISASGDYNQPDANTVVWNIGTLEAGESNSVTLTVKVNRPEPGGIIANKCEIKSGDWPWTLKSAYENTPVCCSPTVTKVDDVNDCIWPGDDVNYTICYSYPNDLNCPDINDVNIIDYLPEEMEFVLSVPEPNEIIDSNKIVWEIGTLKPGDANCIKLKVKVKCPKLGGTITNKCEIRIGGDLYDTAYEETSVCWGCWCPIYVDASAAAGCNNGTSWEDAFRNLQDALDMARICGCNEIRVAAGTYRPDEGAGVEPNDREATFELINGVVIKGGYAGFGAPEPNARDIRQYETILSGDLERNDSEDVDPCDLLSDPCRADNSYHVVTGSGTDETAVLDGFTITAGDANGPSWPDYYGGGMYIVDSNTTVTNCTFTGNSAYYGGGMCNYGGSPTITNCTFSENSADYGGGMYNTWWGSSPTITNCIFIGNSAQYGGGMYNGYTFSRPTVTNCTFSGNWANDGGGICNDQQYGGMTVTNCILWGNSPEQIVNGGSASVTYSDIEDGWEDGNNIDEDPMFEADGYHLTMCSPCIDAGDPCYVAGPDETDIDGEERIMNGRCVGEDVVDMGADEYYLADCNVLEFAHCPKPACRATDVPRDVVLSWRPGIDANTHDVYFGTDETRVSEANNTSGVWPEYKGNQPLADVNYDPPGILDLGQTYYWRIDEVNMAEDPNIWRGDVWHFTVVNYLDVEDFNSYADYGELLLVWIDDGGAPSYVELENDANLVRSGNSMMYEYTDTIDPYCAEGYADTADLPSSIGSDWTAGGVKALSLWFYGQAGNDANEQMYVKLTDGNTPAKNKKVMYNGMSDIREPEWHEWNIDLAAFTGVNLANVARITIGFGDGVAPSGSGHGFVYFEDIRLYLPRCIPERPAGDLTGDCVVDYRDLKIMTDNWLDISCCEDLYKDDKVNFKDFAILANSWLEEGQLWP